MRWPITIEPNHTGLLKESMKYPSTWSLLITIEPNHTGLLKESMKNASTWNSPITIEPNQTGLLRECINLPDWERKCTFRVKRVEEREAPATTDALSSIGHHRS